MAPGSRETWTGYAPLDATLRVQSQAALSDIREGLRRWRSWSYLSVENVKNRYRRTVFGPWWLTLQMVILVGVRADGSLAKGARQRRLLEAEGIPFRGDRVDMRAARLPD